jgi:hypothetical protein
MQQVTAHVTGAAAHCGYGAERRQSDRGSDNQPQDKGQELLAENKAARDKNKAKEEARERAEGGGAAVAGGWSTEACDYRLAPTPIAAIFLPPTHTPVSPAARNQDRAQNSQQAGAWLRSTSEVSTSSSSYLHFKT